jgi:hypothetical protein
VKLAEEAAAIQAKLDAAAAEHRRILEVEAKAAKRLQAETGTWLANQEEKI